MPEVQDVSPAPERRRTLPPEAVAALREAFADEVGTRLPRLLALLDAPPGLDALRDAHALGSSAVVVGEHDASRVARSLEIELVEGVPDLGRVRALVRELAEHLQGWAR